MSTKKKNRVLDIIPENLRAQLIKEILEEANQEAEKERNPGVRYDEKLSGSKNSERKSKQILKKYHGNNNIEKREYRHGAKF